MDFDFKHRAKAINHKMLIIISMFGSFSFMCVWFVGDSLSTIQLNPPSKGIYSYKSTHTHTHSQNHPQTMNTHSFTSIFSISLQRPTSAFSSIPPPPFTHSSYSVCPPLSWSSFHLFILCLRSLTPTPKCTVGLLLIMSEVTLDSSWYSKSFFMSGWFFC